MIEIDIIYPCRNIIANGCNILQMLEIAEREGGRRRYSQESDNIIFYIYYVKNYGRGKRGGGGRLGKKQMKI